MSSNELLNTLQERLPHEAFMSVFIRLSRELGSAQYVSTASDWGVCRGDTTASQSVKDEGFEGLDMIVEDEGMEMEEVEGECSEGSNEEESDNSNRESMIIERLGESNK